MTKHVVKKRNHFSTAPCSRNTDRMAGLNFAVVMSAASLRKSTPDWMIAKHLHSFCLVMTTVFPLQHARRLPCTQTAGGTMLTNQLLESTISSSLTTLMQHPSSTFHTRTVLSLLHVARTDPSGLKATLHSDYTAMSEALM